MALNTNKTGHHVILSTCHIVESGVTPVKLVTMFYAITNIMLKLHSTPIKLATMFYVIPDKLLKVVLNTNKIGVHAIH